ncbi:MAG TPA: 50S ribosomal protein L32 [Candidatus Pacebacteria bacterium]|nr:50S ribosomal protein L32 [Candidatus Paceibacterota bacterium]HAX01101.1 50S ribosomal protein L32 [Candidatus Paceibacterota bacterium]
MGPLPKRRHSKSRAGKRQSQIRPPKLTLVVCKSCGAKKLPHTECPECHAYGSPAAIRAESAAKKTA